MQKISFSDVSQQWLSVASLGVSFTWKNQLTSTVRHLDHYLGQKAIDEITSYDIEKIIKELYTNNPHTNRPSSKRLLKAIGQTANRIFEYAEEKNYIIRNPARKTCKRIPKDAPTRIVEAVSNNQMVLITQFECKTKLAAIIMMFLGLRTGELLALQWSDFNFDNNTLSVNKRCSRIGGNQFEVKSGTKNGKTRVLPIPSAVRDWLMAQWLQSESKLVFPNNEGKLHTPTTWKKCWLSYQNDLNYYVYLKKCKSAGVNPKSKFDPFGIPDMNIGFNPHQLRHTYATLLYLSRVDILTAKELLGHSNVQTTLGIYTHLNDKFKKVNILQFDDYIKKELLNASSL